MGKRAVADVLGDQVDGCGKNRRSSCFPDAGSGSAAARAVWSDGRGQKRQRPGTMQLPRSYQTVLTSHPAYSHQPMTFGAVPFVIKPVAEMIAAFEYMIRALPLPMTFPVGALVKPMIAPRKSP